ncbi:MAG TPA: triose-phosphate isomerase, partial [Chlamydiales bacterium]|nr:triose-phosphate isomerase [Chlamydiales bacterium]
HTEGAYTGEVSGRMIYESGARFVLIGHSERRQYYGETNQSVKLKIQRAVLDGLVPVMCIGETEVQREQGKTTAVLESQLTEGLEGLSDLASLVVAYEPVWAIGTGKSATPEMADEAHAAIHSKLEALGLKAPILYGGSVKPATINELMAKERIDGALVGGASLDVKSFYQIVVGK